MARALGGTTEASFRKAAANIKKAGEQLRKHVGPQGLRLIGEEIMTDIKASSPGHGVPVDTGTLRSTGQVTQVSPLTILLSFGGPAAPYALIQHEETTFEHKVGEARYLVRGVERWRPGGSAAMEALKANAAAALNREKR
jgi:hypothetical protein